MVRIPPYLQPLFDACEAFLVIEPPEDLVKEVARKADKPLGEVLGDFATVRDELYASSSWTPEKDRLLAAQMQKGADISVAKHAVAPDMPWTAFFQHATGNFQFRSLLQNEQQTRAGSSPPGRGHRRGGHRDEVELNVYFGTHRVMTMSIPSGGAVKVDTVPQRPWPPRRASR